LDILWDPTFQRQDLSGFLDLRDSPAGLRSGGLAPSVFQPPSKERSGNSPPLLVRLFDSQIIDYLAENVKVSVVKIIARSAP
jgi:hypothetical protein